MSQQHALRHRGLMVSWAAPGVLPAGWGRWSFPSTQHSWGHNQRTGSSSALLRAKTRGAIGDPRATKEMKGLEHFSCEGWERLGLLSLEKRGFVGSSPMYMNTWKGRVRDWYCRWHMDAAVLHTAPVRSFFSTFPFMFTGWLVSFYLSWTFWGQGNIFILLW